MPKQKVRKKTEYTVNPASRTPVKVKAGPSNRYYGFGILAFLFAGVAWLITYYLGADVTSYGAPGRALEWMADLGSWNFLIGFGLMVVGLLMTMGWR